MTTRTNDHLAYARRIIRMRERAQALTTKTAERIRQRELLAETGLLELLAPGDRARVLAILAATAGPEVAS